ncbi:LysR family transcriptional regulator [Arsenicitalea aurantiaca]|uniref:LysR family transcriptional regulator n=1 Tax=Arsenicitalea aurantiaca TaxID=1783274 RepID=A0A433X2H1_9HYPH|nr:LysR family transcriptional regulator [Arsenicitalea aurantiaca]RUT28278.1 LysR family transcriptional regulator [Arsenicitalea aurantiaca]
MPETGIELRHLRAFRAVMTVGSTLHAAKVLSVSQPSVSRLISELETARAEVLFERRQGRLYPTDSARQLIEEVSRALEGVEAVASADRWGQRPLKIATPHGLATSLLPPVLRAMQERYPRLKFSVDLFTYHEAVNAVAMRRADIGLIKTPVDHPAIALEELVTAPTVALIPQDHPLARLDMVRVRDLRGVPLVLLGRHRPFRVQLDEAMEKAGIVPNVVLETHAVDVARSFVEAGIGITLANALIASREVRPNIAVRSFEISLPHTFAAITSRNAPTPSIVTTALELMKITSRKLVEARS